MIAYFEHSIERAQHLGLIRGVLAFAAWGLRLLPAPKTKELVADGRVYLEVQANRLDVAESLIYSFAQYQSPSVWSVALYIDRLVNHRLDRRLNDIVRAPHFSADYLPLIISSRKRSLGDLRGALDELNFGACTYQIRHQIARARRAIFHEMQNHEALAEDGIRFLSEEPHALILQFTVATAEAAEMAQREDIFILAVRRLLSDRKRIIANPRLLKRHWHEAISVSLALFDIEGAFDIARRAYAAGAWAAGPHLAELGELRVEVADWKHLIDAANMNVISRAEGRVTSEAKESVKLVIPAAAFRTNKIDYPGFRRDIRFAIGAVARSLHDAGVETEVVGRIAKHGEVNFTGISISYHTISNNKNALHFKETDRPSRFSFDTGGYAGWSDFSSKLPVELDLDSIDDKTALDYFRHEQTLVIQGNISKYAQMELSFEENLPERFIFVALQVIGDAVQRLAYASPFEMMDEVIAVATENQLSVVVKRHPQCKSGQISDYLHTNQSRGHLTVSTASIHNLIAMSQAVCVVNSGVGAEALLHEKPVYVFGQADYMQACYICRKPGDFRRLFKSGTSNLTTSELHKFWYMLRNHYAVDLASRSEAEKWISRRVRKHLDECSDEEGASRSRADAV